MIGPATRVYPFKGRRLKPAAPVEAYRNLTRSGVWYSLRQGGLVVAHAQTVLLMDVEFVVNDLGRQRVLKTGRRNVHAYVRGTIRYAERFRDTCKYKAGYNPHKNTHFWVDYAAWREGTYRFDMKAAGCALLNHHGLTVDEPEILPP